jgi:Fe2+ or Zn2+ uptake regulation protein
MTAAVAEQRLLRLRERSAALGLRMTPQREVLLRVLSRAPNHPTADQLYRQVRRLLPSVSPATVYRNVQDLVRAGLLAPLERAGAAVQYEVNPDDHHHFVCRGCGRVWDVYLRTMDYALDRKRAAVPAARIDRAEVQLLGLCARCASKPASNTPHK